MNSPQWGKGFLIISIPLTLLIWWAFSVFAPHGTMSAVPSQSSSGSATSVQVPSATPSDPNARKEQTLAPIKNEFERRVVAYETARHTFDWQKPNLHSTSLNGFMTADSYKKLIASEKQDVVLARMVDSKTVKTVTNVTLVSGELEGDLAESVTRVKIKSTSADTDQASTYTFTSVTHWVKVNGRWYAYETGTG